MSLSLMCSSYNMARPPSLGNLRNPPAANSLVVSSRHFRPLRAQLSTERIKVETANEVWPYEVELTVRDYELDQFGVVNNATYAHYCEHARLAGLKHIGCIGADTVAGKGRALALAELSLQFIAPLRSGDRFLVKARLGGRSMARLIVDHYIVKLPHHEPILKARATAVWLDENYRPTRIPPEVVSNIIEVEKLQSNCRVDKSN